jgi:hypothetical protein
MNLKYAFAESRYWDVYRNLVTQLKERTHLNKAKYQKEQGKWECVLQTRKLLRTRKVFLTCGLV